MDLQTSKSFDNQGMRITEELIHECMFYMIWIAKQVGAKHHDLQNNWLTVSRWRNIVIISMFSVTSNVTSSPSAAEKNVEY